MKKSKVYEASSIHWEKSIEKIGASIRLARKRRSMSMQELADRMQVSYQTLSRLEKGDPTISIGIMASALEILGLLDDVKKLAAPETDEFGIEQEKRNLPQRIRKKKDKGFSF